MAHFLPSETGMPVARIMYLQKIPNGLLAQLCRKDFPSSDERLEPMAIGYEDVPKTLHRFSRTGRPLIHYLLKQIASFGFREG